MTDRHWHLTEIGKREMVQGKVMRAEWFSSPPGPMEILVLASMLGQREVSVIGPVPPGEAQPQ